MKESWNESVGYEKQVQVCVWLSYERMKQIEKQKSTKGRKIKEIRMGQS
ncbi:hypothetical protein [Enterococcus faecium]|nr:hypothetical protein [Enterococcus faecium]